MSSATGRCRNTVKGRAVRSRECFTPVSACADQKLNQIGFDPALPRTAIDRSEDLFGIGIATLVLVETGQVFQDIREIRMVRTERFLVGGHRALVKPLGIGVTPLARVKRGQIVQRLRDIGMVKSERLLRHRHRLS